MCSSSIKCFTLKRKFSKSMWKRGKNKGKGVGGFEKVFEI
jgi:hypothetical protein